MPISNMQPVSFSASFPVRSHNSCHFNVRPPRSLPHPTLAYPPCLRGTLAVRGSTPLLYPQTHTNTLSCHAYVRPPRSMSHPLLASPPHMRQRGLESPPQDPYTWSLPHSLPAESRARRWQRGGAPHEHNAAPWLACSDDIFRPHWLTLRLRVRAWAARAAWEVLEAWAGAGIGGMGGCRYWRHKRVQA